MNKQFAGALAGLLIPGIIFIAYSAFLFPAAFTAASLAVIVLYALAFYAYGRRLDERMLRHATVAHITLGTLALAFSLFNLAYLFVIVLAVTAGFVVAKSIFMRDLAKVLFMFGIVALSVVMMFEPTIIINQSSPPILDDNWWAALNWMKNNTEACGTVATYWDPGHFIRAIANRPVVFDGASQNALWNATIPSNYSYEQMKDAAVIDEFTTTNLSDGRVLIETARIQDISTALMTDNETLAVRILDKFRLANCSTVYFLATSDLIDKSYWWSYFATWNPIDKGCATPMSVLGLASTSPSASGETVYTFQGGIPTGCNQQIPAQIIVTQQNNTYSALALINGQLLPIQEFSYYTQFGIRTTANENAPVKGTALMDQNRGSIIFIPPQLAGSMFTKMMFFNGEGLQRIKFVNSWGGELKLYKVTY
jgi:dolichyl-diphosphooligosaccharide--protein glycosyltransferase